MARIKDRYGWIAKGRQASMEVRLKQAYAKATELVPIIAEIQAAGVTTPYGIAKALNARGIPTVNGKAKWRELGVRRVLARLKLQDPARIDLVRTAYVKLLPADPEARRHKKSRS
jgi:hypothetical protein